MRANKFAAVHCKAALRRLNTLGASRRRPTLLLCWRSFNCRIQMRDDEFLAKDLRERAGDEGFVHQVGIIRRKGEAGEYMWRHSENSTFYLTMLDKHDSKDDFRSPWLNIGLYVES